MSSSSENEIGVAIFLLRDDGALLCQLRDEKPGLAQAGKWTPPGGHCEAGERLELCIRRELREETGYDCSWLKPLGSFVDDSVPGSPPCTVITFWSLYDGIQAVDCLEGQAMKFIERPRAAQYRIPPRLLELWDLAIAALKDKMTHSEQVS